MTAPALGPGIKTNPGAVWKSAALSDSAAAVPGHAVFITTTLAGTATVTLMDKTSTIIVNLALGDNIYPFAAYKVAAGTATISNMYNLYAQ